MKYNTIAFAHALLEKEAGNRHLQYMQARDQYDAEAEGQHRTKELKRLAHLRDDAYTYYAEAARILEDFEDHEWQ